MVQTVKSILNKVTDPYLGLLSYQATPLANGYSPAELLMRRKLCSTIPMLPEMYKPSLPPHSEILQKEQLYRSKQQKNFNKHHRARQLKALQTGNQFGFLNFSNKLQFYAKFLPALTSFKPLGEE